MKLMATFLLGISILNCSPSSTAAVIPPVVVPPTLVVTDIEFWLTKADQSVKLEKQTAILKFGTAFNNYNSVEINDASTFQEMEGFGYTLTGGSAQVINQLGTAAKKDLLQDILSSYINIDLIQIADIKKIPELRNIIKLLATRIGSKLDISKIANTTKRIFRT